MAVTTVAQFAAQLNRPPLALLEQLQSAGVTKQSPDDALTEADKERLLDFLRNSHGTAATERKKITVTRKSTSEIKQADSSGKARTIQVEVRKKRTFVKRDDVPAGSEEALEPAGPSAEELELQRREEEALRQAELIRQQEAELAERRRLREEQERAERETAAAAAAEAAAQAAAEAAKAAVAAATEKPSTTAAEAAAPAVAAAPPVVVEPPKEAPKPTLRVVKAADIAAEDTARQADLERRKKAVEVEAAAIRAMMSGRAKVMVAKKPEEPKPVEAAKDAIKGTIHKPKAVAGAPGAAVAKPGD